MKCHKLFLPQTHSIRRRRRKRILLTDIISLVITLGLSAGVTQAAHISGSGHEGQTGAIYVATIARIQVADPLSTFSGGLITLEGGHTVLIPENLVMDLPANRLTLQQFCFGPDVPLAEQGIDPVTGHSACGIGHVAQILANRQSDGTVVAGDVFIHKNEYDFQGIVTAINADGSLVIDDTHLVRLNDPEAVHTKQVADITATPGNGSPDVRYTNDPTNYTITGTTGYPFCINGPNCLPNSGRLGGVTAATVLDSNRFEPVLVGDWVSATGNIENLGAPDQFQSAHTLLVGVQIDTQPGTADYVVVLEAEWDVGGWSNQRLKGLNIGAMTSNSTASITRVVLNGASDATPLGACEKQEYIGGTADCTTVGGNCTANTAANVVGGALQPGNGQIIKIVYDWDFIIGESKPFRNPAAMVRAAGDPSGLLDPNASDANNAFSVFSPVGRDVVYSTSGYLACQAGTGPCFDVRDANNNPAQWGFYISPNGIGHPEWEEIDLAAARSPFIFEGMNWNMDRRLGPGGGDDPLASVSLYDSSMALRPFPSSGSSPCATIDALPGLFLPTNCSLSFTTQDTCTGQPGPVDTSHLVTDPSALLAVLAAHPAPVPSVPAGEIVACPQTVEAVCPVITEPASVDPVLDPAPVVADPVVADPVVADPVVADPVIADPVVADPVVADPAAGITLSGLVDTRGRLRIDGFCPIGTTDIIVSDPTVRCTVTADGSVRCRGIRLEPGVEITATCSPITP